MKIEKNLLWNQFGAAIDTLQQAIDACSEQVWSNDKSQPLFWYSAFHTLFWLDYCLSDTPEGFLPPPPFSFTEMDPEGVLPERVYTKQELLEYIKHCRKKAKHKIEKLTEEKATENFQYFSRSFPVIEMLMYMMRHVQHHAAQLNLLLRQQTNSAPGWVAKAKTGLNENQ